MDLSWAAQPKVSTPNMQLAKQKQNHSLSKSCDTRWDKTGMVSV
jgi:hypothetical protein